MSILDGLPKTEAEWQQAIELAMPFVERLEANLVMTPAQKEAWQLVKQGIPLADIYGITKEEREALLAHCLRLIQKGETRQARSLLFQLYKLYPYDARVLYAAGVSLQIENDIPNAAKMFMIATAQNATNPECYLRLGECFLIAKEYENAGGAFTGAEDLCERGYGTAQNHEYATKMLAHIKARLETETEHH